LDSRNTQDVLTSRYLESQDLMKMHYSFKGLFVHCTRHGFSVICSEALHITGNVQNLFAQEGKGEWNWMHETSCITISLLEK